MSECCYRGVVTSGVLALLIGSVSCREDDVTPPFGVSRARIVGSVTSGASPVAGASITIEAWFDTGCSGLLLPVERNPVVVRTSSAGNYSVVLSAHGFNTFVGCAKVTAKALPGAGITVQRTPVSFLNERTGTAPVTTINVPLPSPAVSRLGMLGKAPP
jgi:hypothetical protein